jgi:hypothetical protein
MRGGEVWQHSVPAGRKTMLRTIQLKHRAELFAVELGRHGQEQRVWARALLPQLARASQVGAELVVVPIAIGQLPAEQLRGLAAAVDQQRLADDALRRHREGVLVAHARQQEGDLELGGLLGRGRRRA